MHVELYRHPCTVISSKRLRESGQFSTSIATFFPIFHAYRSQNTGNSTTTLPSIIDSPLATRFFTSRFFSRKRNAWHVCTNSVTSLFRSRWSIENRLTWRRIPSICENSRREYIQPRTRPSSCSSLSSTGSLLERPWASTSTTLDVKNEPCKNRRV